MEGRGERREGGRSRFTNAHTHTHTHTHTYVYIHRHTIIVCLTFELLSVVGRQFTLLS